MFDRCRGCGLESFCNDRIVNNLNFLPRDPGSLREVVCDSARDGHDGVCRLESPSAPQRHQAIFKPGGIGYDLRHRVVLGGYDLRFPTGDCPCDDCRCTAMRHAGDQGLWLPCPKILRDLRYAPHHAVGFEIEDLNVFFEKPAHVASSPSCDQIDFSTALAEAVGQVYEDAFDAADHQRWHQQCDSHSMYSLDWNFPIQRYDSLCMGNPEKHGGEDPILRPVMPELNTVRGVAVLMVFLFHAFEDFIPAAQHLPAWERVFLSTLSLGWMGVNLFFVLSGFLITGILLGSVSRPHYYSRFYRRRALRILPAYYLLLVVLVLVSRLSFVRQHTSLAFAGLSFGYLSTLTPLLGVPRDYAPLWSLAVEEHFYLIWPTAVRVFTRRGLVIAAASICICEP